MKIYASTGMDGKFQFKTEMGVDYDRCIDISKGTFRKLRFGPREREREREILTLWNL